MKWTFTTIIAGKRKDGLPAPGGKISITLETDETRPSGIIMSLYHKGMIYTEGSISIAASIIPLSAIVNEIEQQDERGLHRNEVFAQTKTFVKMFQLLESSGRSGPVAEFDFVLDTPGATAY